MKLNKAYYIIFALNANSQTLYNGVGHIPANYQVPWTEAGLLQDVCEYDSLTTIRIPGTLAWSTSVFCRERSHKNCFPGAIPEVFI